mgnify:CR=1 FL=1
MLARFTGCLLGGAVGDTLGANAIVDHAPLDGAAPSGVTGDTQVTLFTAVGLPPAGSGRNHGGVRAGASR